MKRYNLILDDPVEVGGELWPHMEESEDGYWVRYEDVASRDSRQLSAVPSEEEILEYAANYGTVWNSLEYERGFISGAQWAINFKRGIAGSGE
jgi:hypothetical protein